MGSLPERPPTYEELQALSDEEYNATGTFMYPPYPRSAEQLYLFYKYRLPTDEQLAKFADGYGAARAVWCAGELGVIDVDLKHKYGANTDRATEEHWKAVDRLEKVHPKDMNPLFARDIAKAVQIFRFSAALPDDERDNALAYKITKANGQRVGIREYANRYLANDYEADLV